MKAWLHSFPDLPDTVASPADLARLELESALPGTPCTLEHVPAMGESYRVEKTAAGYTVSGGDSGLLYGAYALITRILSGESVPPVLASAPKYGLRMVDCWDNPDGTIERGYSGRSLFFEGNRLVYDPARMRELGRLLASVGLNVLCINNVNVHFPGQLLLEDMLPEAAALADIFRPFGIRLMFSIDFSQPMRHGIPTADPLDSAVQAWWKETAARVWTAIPDLAGFLVKADSEGRPGPFTYNRNHAEGANMLAEAVKPYGGIIVWRCFVYNCRQDWRDRTVDRPKAAFEHYAWLDGQFADNVILQIKHGPFDFQVREPVSPLLLAMKHTNLAMELQLAQEYTGHQIDLYTMIPMWRELFAEMPADNIMSIAAVSNLGRDANYTGHPLAAVNLFTYGLLAWDPDTDAEASVSRWARLTYDFTPEQHRCLVSLLLSTRRTYEKYTAPLGIGWMVNPHDHYGPNPSGYEYDLWGTYHKADRNAVGIDRTASGTGYLEQYSADLQEKYGDPATCPDLYLLFYHRLPYSFVMKDGRTLIQRIYDDHFEGLEETKALAEAIAALPFPEPDRAEIFRRMELQLRDAREWCDIINTFFHRLSGVPDTHGRVIYD
ncbi:MAG: alpha-glucuronidase [Clostridiales bacterium]|nr:alpha-glucuronidase [Clostridiales bacterium]